MTYLIHHFLENSADSCPDKEAFVHGKVRLTYKEIEKRSNAVANWLLDSKLLVGDRVALLLRNSDKYVFAYYGVLKAGCIVVPLNTGLEYFEITQMVEDCEPRVLITEKYFAKTIQKLCINLRCTPEMIVSVDEDIKLKKRSERSYVSLPQILYQYSNSRPNLSLIDNDLSSIIYTSGSTGKPKGVMLSHLNVVTNTRSITEYLCIDENDRCMVVLPFYYVYGKSLLNTHFAASGTIVVDNRFTFTNAVLKNMIEERITAFAGVPSTYSILLNRSSIAKMSFPHLRYLTQAGGNMPSKVKKGLLEIFPDKEIYIMYGATEASARISYLPPKKLIKRLSSIGKAIPNVEMKVVDENDNETQPGDEGEIVVRGSNIMSGYWNSPEETKKVLKDNWYFTGDLGTRDAQGYFYITGRKRDMIKVGFHKISAIEIEELLYNYTGVIEVAVIGVPDETQDEAVVAVVVLKDETMAQVEDIKRFCKKKIAGL